MTHAYRPKGESITLNQIIQSDRDNVPCTCGHKNVSHAYPPMRYADQTQGDYTIWPDGSQIGMGRCGVEYGDSNATPCPCIRFIDATREKAA